MVSTGKEGSKAKLFKGAAILAAAGLFARLLGVAYRIPLAGMLGDEGVGLFEMANPIYYFLLSVSVAGIPLAISKLIAEKKALDDGDGARKVLKVAIIMMSVTGITASIALFVFAPVIAEKVYRDPRAVLSLRGISPALAFMTVMSAMRGYFQGVQRMVPSALSQMVEQIARVSFMLTVAYILLPRGIEYGAAGAASGAAVGAFLGMVLIIAMYYYLRNKPAYHIPSGGRKPESGGVIASRILKLSVPVAITGSLASIKSVIDAAIVPGRLAAAGFTTSQATALYGQLNGMAFPLIYFPTSIISGLASAAVPSVSESMAKGDKEGLKERAIYILKLTSIIAFPATVGMFVLASPITKLLFSRPDVGPLLAVFSAASALLCLQQTSSSVLSGMGHVGDPLISALVGVAVKIGLEFYLTSLPGLNVKGAAISTVIGSLVSVVINLVQVERRLGGKVGYRKAFIAPAAASVAMGAIVYGIYTLASKFVPESGLLTLASVGAGGLAYVLILLFLGGMSADELEAIPVVGRRAAAFASKMGLRRRS